MQDLTVSLTEEQFARAKVAFATTALKQEEPAEGEELVALTDRQIAERLGAWCGNQIERVVLSSERTTSRTTALANVSVADW